MRNKDQKITYPVTPVLPVQKATDRVEAKAEDKTVQTAENRSTCKTDNSHRKES